MFLLEIAAPFPWRNCSRCSKDLDFSVFKQFGVTEQSRLQFRAAFFTLTNTSSFNASV